MVTLEETFELTNIKDDEVVVLKSYPVGTNSGIVIATRKKIEESFDVKLVKVYRVCPRFVCGDYEGFEFAVSGVEFIDNSTIVL